MGINENDGQYRQSYGANPGALQPEPKAYFWWGQESSRPYGAPDGGSLGTQAIRFCLK